MSPDGEALCLACGFCCDGTLHTHTVLQPDEAGRLAGLGLRLDTFRGKTGFYQPCPLHQNGRCSAYAARPLVCRSYECALFKRYAAAAVTWAEADAIIRAARGLRDALRQQAPSQRSFRGLLKTLLDAADADPHDPGLADELSDEAVLAQILTLATHLHRYFDESEQENPCPA